MNIEDYFDMKEDFLKLTSEEFYNKYPCIKVCFNFFDFKFDFNQFDINEFFDKNPTRTNDLHIRDFGENEHFFWVQENIKKNQQIELYYVLKELNIPKKLTDKYNLNYYDIDDFFCVFHRFYRIVNENFKLITFSGEPFTDKENFIEILIELKKNHFKDHIVLDGSQIDKLCDNSLILLKNISPENYMPIIARIKKLKNSLVITDQNIIDKEKSPPKDDFFLHIQIPNLKLYISDLFEQKLMERL